MCLQNTMKGMQDFTGYASYRVRKISNLIHRKERDLVNQTREWLSIRDENYLFVLLASFLHLILMSNSFAFLSIASF